MSAHDARMAEIDNRRGALVIAQRRLARLCREAGHDATAIRTARAAVADRDKHLQAAIAALRIERTAS